ncbi:Ribokinase [Eubacterium plexicaudatum ASF492]|nr:Ribokinase [Eubacterium plexicaudatum ASF492]
MAKLGAEVEMFGCVGEDSHGSMLLENLKQAGDDLKSALEYANVAAGLSTEKFGAQTGMPTAEEVARVMAECVHANVDFS